MNLSIRRLLSVALVVTLTVGLGSCAGSGGESIPANISNLYFPPIQNKSKESGFEDIVKDEAIQEFNAQGNLDLVNKQEADAMVQARITSYQKIPLIYNESDVVQQWKLRVELAMVIRDVQTNEVLWSRRGIFRETTYSDVRPPIETELGAQRRVARQLARDIVTSTVQGWPYIEG